MLAHSQKYPSSVFYCVPTVYLVRVENVVQIRPFSYLSFEYIRVAFLKFQINLFILSCYWNSQTKIWSPLSIYLPKSVYVCMMMSVQKQTWLGEVGPNILCSHGKAGLGRDMGGQWPTVLVCLGMMVFQECGTFSAKIRMVLGKLKCLATPDELLVFKIMLWSCLAYVALVVDSDTAALFTIVRNFLNWDCCTPICLREKLRGKI